MYIHPTVDICTCTQWNTSQYSGIQRRIILNWTLSGTTHRFPLFSKPLSDKSGLLINKFQKEDFLIKTQLSDLKTDAFTVLLTKVQFLLTKVAKKFPILNNRGNAAKIFDLRKRGLQTNTGTKTS